MHRHTHAHARDGTGKINRLFCILLCNKQQVKTETKQQKEANSSWFAYSVYSRFSFVRKQTREKSRSINADITFKIHIVLRICVV